MFGLPRPETMINFVAGLVGILFDRVNETEADEERFRSEADDLTVISGIGPTFARRLNDAGITSYVQLANLSPDEVVTITHVAEWQGNPEDWISQAESRG